MTRINFTFVSKHDLRILMKILFYYLRIIIINKQNYLDILNYEFITVNLIEILTINTKRLYLSKK